MSLIFWLVFPLGLSDLNLWHFYLFFSVELVVAGAAIVVVSVAACFLQKNDFRILSLHSESF